MVNLIVENKNEVTEQQQKQIQLKTSKTLVEKSRVHEKERDETNDKKGKNKEARYQHHRIVLQKSWESKDREEILEVSRNARPPRKNPEELV